ncbi:AAA family ATPase [Novosphingobium sp.]|uniref:AAA family ATPase n=1 Tax=Novosphingobium sp. TaxID=1874826 RepID=UPI003342BFD5
MAKVLSGAGKVFVSHTPGVRPRIDRISIQNFRAFPGTGNPEIDLNGKNLLVYGENGAGKSSIFHALDEFFSIDPATIVSRKKLLESQANIFSPDGSELTSVTVTFAGGDPIAWSDKGHPVDIVGVAPVVIEGAYRKAMLDYRALLDVNYKFIGQDINLFPAFISVLLRDMPVPYNGTPRELARIWRRTKSFFDARHTASRRDLIDAMMAAINAAIDLTLPALKDATNKFLKLLKCDDLEIVDFEFSHLGCNWTRPRAARKIRNQKIGFMLKQRGEEIGRPHHFLNEARLSSLALAFYLAGRQIMTQTLQLDTPKLMVLDDVLVGLDQSNRLPVLDLLKTEFEEWQIVLLTHDRVWFEMARAHLPEEGAQAWTTIELFEGTDPSGVTRPVQRPHNMDQVIDNLTIANTFLAANHDNAAAVHTRIAFEQSLKKFCEKRSVPVAFKANPKELKTEDLLNAVDAWLVEPKHAAKRAAKKVVLDPLLQAARASQRVILNPYSHSTPVTLAKGEVKSAIDAVQNLNAEFRK